MSMMPSFFRPYFPTANNLQASSIQQIGLRRREAVQRLAQAVSAVRSHFVLLQNGRANVSRQRQSLLGRIYLQIHAIQ